MSSVYTAVCECGRSSTVEPAQMGKRHPCHCGFTLLMPTLDDFRRNPVQQAYPSVLRKVDSHIEAGLLPGVEGCQGCGTPSDCEVEVLVLCEQSRTETTGGTGPWVILLALFTILFSPVFILLGSEPGETTHHGRDTSTRVPACLCQPCQRRLSSRRIAAGLAILAGGVAVSAAVGVFAGWWALIPAAVTLLVLGIALQTAKRRKRQECKEMLAVVPGYAELLKAYRFAEVVVPRVGK